MKSFQIALTEDEARIVVLGLMELPFKVSARVLNKIQTQTQAQAEDKKEQVHKEVLKQVKASKGK